MHLLQAASRVTPAHVTGTGVAVWIVAVIAIVVFGIGWYLAGGDRVQQLRHDRGARRQVRKFHKSSR